MEEQKKNQEIDEERTKEEGTQLDEAWKEMNNSPNEFVVENALLSCTKAKEGPQSLLYQGEKKVIKYTAGGKRRRLKLGEEKAVDINNRKIADVGDAKGGMRDDKEGKEEVNIISMGNCKYIEEGRELEEVIEERWGGDHVEKILKALEEGLGTCYCFMEVNEEWENIPRSIFENQGLPVAGVGSEEKRFSEMEKRAKEGESRWKAPAEENRNNLRFYEKEVITKQSMLFCIFGEGFIQVLESNQNRERDLWLLIQQIKGNKVESLEEILEMLTQEILARILYQEAVRQVGEKGQNAVLYSILNRLCSEKGFGGRGKGNSIYDIIASVRQYTSIYGEPGTEPNAYRPPIIGDRADDLEAWENAKRLAAILYYAVETYGAGNPYTEGRGEKVVLPGEEGKKMREEIMAFIAEQEDIRGEKIENPIGERDSFFSIEGYYKEGGKDKDTTGTDIKECGGNIFYPWV